MDNLYSEIEKDLGLMASKEQQKIASDGDFLDPLSAQIANFLANASDDEMIIKEASVPTVIAEIEPELDFDNPAGISEQEEIPQTLSNVMIGIEKKAGKPVFDDDIKRFVYNAEQNGFSMDQIEEWIDENMDDPAISAALNKEALYAPGAGLGLSMLGRAITAPFKGLARGLKANQAKKTALGLIQNRATIDTATDQAVAEAIRRSGAGIQKAPGLADRLIDVVNPNHWKNKRISQEMGLKGTIDDLIAAEPDLMGDPKRIKDLVAEVTGGTAESPGLKYYMSKGFKAPTETTRQLRAKALEGLSPSERAAAQVADRFDKLKKNKALVGGAGGAGLAYLAATRDRASGGRRGGGQVLVL